MKADAAIDESLLVCESWIALFLQLWQAFVGIKARRVESYYRDLLNSETSSGYTGEQQTLQSENDGKGSPTDCVSISEKWKGQIEKVFIGT